MVITRTRPILPAKDSKLGLLCNEINDAFHVNSKILVSKSRVSFNRKSDPVIGITCLNVKSDKLKTNTIAKGYGNNFKTFNRDIILVSTLYDKNVTKLTDSQVTFNPFPKEGGVTEIKISLVSGKHCEITLIGSDSDAKISQIDGLPASLEFDTLTSTITGTPFVTGEHLANVLLTNGISIKLTINVIPLSLCSGI